MAAVRAAAARRLCGRVAYDGGRRQLAHEDLSDVGILQLAGVLAPVVLLAADRDLIGQGVAVPNWEAVRGVLGRIGRAEAGMEGSTSTIVAAGYGLAGAVRLARAHPVSAGVAVAAASTYAYLNRSRLLERHPCEARPVRH
ncbi:hypothetical protein [Streptomyces griseoflavus]|uniref:hypothetical protein n=1 Tax=Streptomyces griseoflavus TaxID=35619 RepID=UPI00167EF948|nr:hypothetical protein [Streptomyces griseoflavus]